MNPTANPNRRSCQQCSRKKIRCDKSQPCTNCSKSQLECIFPGSGRAPRRKKRPLKAELISRLNRLEDEVKGLREYTEEANRVNQRSCSENAVVPENAAGGQRGRLIVGNGYSRYVTHDALVNVEDQIKELQDDVEDSPVQSAEGNGKDSRSAFIFGYSSITNSLHHYHPGTTQSQFLLNIYEERVAPMVMIFHKPSIRKSIYKASTNAEYIDQTSESVVFSIYFAAATSLKPSECLHYLGEEHTTVRQRMRFAVQQALARVEFLTTRNLAVLQAMVLFLTCLRQPEDADFVWTMSAVALRLARGLGLHRDGTQFRLSPFESEMRRRLWWYIYLLDIQICEYHAISSGIDEDSVDTGLPSNIDDAEISPESKEVSSTEARFTEMTFCLARCEMITHNRRLARTSASLPLEQTLQELRKIHTHIQEKYLQYCDVSVPIQWVTATILRLAIARSWLVAHFPRLASDVFPPLDSSTRNQLFRTAVEVTEFACLLETDERTTKWSWLFKGYVQWHAIAFVLSELCNREESSDDLRAWTVVEGAYNRWKERDFRERGIVLKAVTRLMERATRRHGRSMRVAEGCPEHVDWSMDDSNTGVAYMNLFRDFLRNGRT